MKQTLGIISLLLVLFSCTQKKQEVVVQTEIPVILQNHPDKALFTQMNGAQFISLFNGTDLSGWYTYTSQYGVNNDTEKAFSITDGALHFTGENMGYISTNDSYKNYYLRVIFRWGETKYPPRLDNPRDSGILYHFPDSVENRVWPTSVECQIQENDCGDYWLVGGVTAESSNQSRQEGALRRIIRTANFENPNPEWNTIEIICIDNKSEHYVNGHLVNQAHNLSVSEGKILLQLEGAEIFYKSVELLHLK
jgi:hypothetical protein